MVLDLVHVGVVYQRFIAQFRLRSVGFTTSWVVCVTTRCKIISSEYESRKSKQSARHNQLSRYWLTSFIVNCTDSIQWHNQTSSQWCSQRGWKGTVDFHPLSNSGAHFHWKAKPADSHSQIRKLADPQTRRPADSQTRRLALAFEAQWGAAFKLKTGRGLSRRAQAPMVDGVS